MLTLAQIVSALQQEMKAALPQKLALPGGVQAEADRVVISLQFDAREVDTGRVEFLWSLPQSSTNGLPQKSLHTLTLEFKAPSSTTSISKQPLVSETLSPTPLVPSAAGPERIKEALSQIFGVPGFDSSARATVFREALADLTADQVQIVVQSFSGPPPEEDAARRSRALLLKLLKSAPLDDLERSKALLVEVLTQNALESVLSLVAREWKTQEDWL